MATWNDLAGYLRTNYKILEDKETLLSLSFGFGDGRSQLVHVGRATMEASQGEWATIVSVFADVDSADIPRALQEAASFVVGGVVIIGDKLALRHAVPLSNLNLNEFEEPFQMVMAAADVLEHQFTGADQF